MSETKRTSVDVVVDFIGGAAVSPEEQDALRSEFRLMLDTISMVRESLGALSTQANERSRVAGDPGENTDPWVIGYLAGKTRESQAAAGALGALQNNMDVWAAARRQVQETGT